LEERDTGFDDNDTGLEDNETGFDESDTGLEESDTNKRGQGVIKLRVRSKVSNSIR